MFRRRPEMGARDRLVRAVMLNLLWAGISATTLGLCGGLDAAAGPVVDVAYKQAPVSLTGAGVLLVAGPALLLVYAVLTRRTAVKQ